MKNLIEIIIAFVCASLTFYVVGAFVVLDMNPANWPEVLRWYIAMCSLIVGGMIASANYR